MQEARIEHSALDRFAEKLEQAPQVMKEAKRHAFQAAAPRLLAAVRTEIGGSGKVQRWQGAYVGSKGGYAAARPRAKTFAEDRRGRETKYAVGYVTNAINSGHGPPRNKAGYYASTRRVAGKQFYQRAQARAEDVAQETGQQIIQALKDHLEGG